MKDWQVESLGVLKFLTAPEAEKALTFVQQHKTAILKVLLSGWGIVLAMTFTAIMTVRIALHLPL